MVLAKRFRIAVVTCLTSLLLYGLPLNGWSQERSEAKQQRAHKLVQAALEAEIGEAASKRQNLLDQADQVSHNELSVHWQRGEVQIGKAWKNYSQVVESAQKSKQLELYRELRDKSEPTLASQYELALYCLKHGLREHAAAHWSAILELDGDHIEARKALGFIRQGDQWLKAEQIISQRETANKVAAALKDQGPELKEIAAKLRSGALSQKDAFEYLRSHASIHAIPGWELYLSSAHPEGAGAVVEALATLDSPEASLSLARHAVWSGSSIIRDAAIDVLKTRDPNSFMPAMLGELQGPWVAFRAVASDANNRLVTRYTVVADSKEKMNLQVLDESFVMLGNQQVASNTVASTVSAAAAVREGTRRQANSQISQRNAAIMKALAAISGESELETPEDWWQWWDNKNEVYATGLKPLQASYAYRNQNVVGSLPLTNSNSSFTRDDRESQTRKKDCLAAGTPVMTERGPVNIERIRMGDRVLAKHHETGELRLQPVLRTTIRDPEPLVRITLQADTNVDDSSNVIRSSGGHPFWVSGQGWQRARLLEPGMRLHCMNGFVTVKSIEIEDKVSRTYNLIVDEFHSYFAGSSGVLTHDNSLVAPTRCKVPGLLD